MSIEVLKQALEALEDAKQHGLVYVNEIVDLRQAIAEAEKQEPVAFKCGDAIVHIRPPVYGNTHPQPKAEQEPVAWMYPCIGKGRMYAEELDDSTGWQPLYTHPQPKAEQEPDFFKQIGNQSMMQLWQNYCDVKVERDELQEKLAKAEQTIDKSAAIRIATALGWEPKREPMTVRVWGWVWKDKRHEDCYVPSYTPAQHVPRGELLALVDPAELHKPLESTVWHTLEAAHGIKDEA